MTGVPGVPATTIYATLSLLVAAIPSSSFKPYTGGTPTETSSSSRQPRIGGTVPSSTLVGGGGIRARAAISSSEEKKAAGARRKDTAGSPATKARHTAATPGGGGDRSASSDDHDDDTDTLRTSGGGAAAEKDEDGDAYAEEGGEAWSDDEMDSSNTSHRRGDYSGTAGSTSDDSLRALPESLSSRGHDESLQRELSTRTTRSTTAAAAAAGMGSDRDRGDVVDRHLTTLASPTNAAVLMQATNARRFGAKAKNKGASTTSSVSSTTSSGGGFLASIKGNILSLDSIIVHCFVVIIKVCVCVCVVAIIGMLFGYNNMVALLLSASFSRVLLLCCLCYNTNIVPVVPQRGRNPKRPQHRCQHQAVPS